MGLVWFCLVPSSRAQIEINPKYVGMNKRKKGKFPGLKLGYGFEDFEINICLGSTISYFQRIMLEKNTFSIFRFLERRSKIYTNTPGYWLVVYCK